MLNQMDKNKNKNRQQQLKTICYEGLVKSRTERPIVWKILYINTYIHPLSSQWDTH